MSSLLINEHCIVLYCIVNLSTRWNTLLGVYVCVCVCVCVCVLVCLPPDNNFQTKSYMTEVFGLVDINTVQVKVSGQDHYGKR